MQPSTELNILKLVCHRLEKADILYMLTGSFAINFYAVPRMTRDIDIVIEIRESEIEPLFQLFQHDFYVDKDAIREAIDHQGMFNIIHNNSVFKIDFIIRKDTIYRHTEFQRRRQIQLDDQRIWIVSPEDLILSKLYWAKESSSELQLRDIRNLFSNIQNLEYEYIYKWIEKLGLTSIYEKVKADG